MKQFRSIVTIIVIIAMLMFISMTSAAHYGTISLNRRDQPEAPSSFECESSTLYLSALESGGLIHFFTDLDDTALIEPCLRLVTADIFPHQYFTAQSDLDAIQLCWDNNVFTPGADPICPQSPGQACTTDVTHCFGNLACGVDGECDYPALPDSSHKQLKIQMTNNEFEMEDWLGFMSSEYDKVMAQNLLDFSTTDFSYNVGDPNDYSQGRITMLFGLYQNPEETLIAMRDAFNTILNDYNNDPDIDPKVEVDILMMLIPFQPDCWTAEHQLDDEKPDCLDMSIITPCDVEPMDEDCPCANNPFGQDCPCVSNPMAEGCPCIAEPMTEGCPCANDPSDEGCPCEDPAAEECPTRCDTDNTLTGCVCEDPTAEECPTRCDTDNTLVGCVCHDPKGAQCPTRCDADSTLTGCVCEDPTAEECPTRCDTDNTLTGCPCEDPKGAQCPTRCISDPTLTGCPRIDPCVIDPKSQACKDSLEEESNNASSSILMASTTSILQLIIVVVIGMVVNY